MSELRSKLKQPSGWFAAGAECKQAMRILSDGAFKLFVHLCLNADRHTGKLRFRMAELAAATGHSVRSVSTYLEQLRQMQVCDVYVAANQHEFGRMEIRDAFWPYQKEAANNSTDPEQAHYVSRVRSLFLSPGCVDASFSVADEKLAAEWYRKGIPLEHVDRAILLGSARKYVAWSNQPERSWITSLQYFSGIVEEVARMETPMEYWRYLAARVRKMESNCRAHAKFAGASSKTQKETN